MRFCMFFCVLLVSALRFLVAQASSTRGLQPDTTFLTLTRPSLQIIGVSNRALLPVVKNRTTADVSLIVVFGMFAFHNSKRSCSLNKKKT